jgi:hypothetical protein
VRRRLPAKPVHPYVLVNVAVRILRVPEHPELVRDLVRVVPGLELRLRRLASVPWDAQRVPDNAMFLVV